MRRERSGPRRWPTSSPSNGRAGSPSRTTRDSTGWAGSGRDHRPDGSVNFYIDSQPPVNTAALAVKAVLTLRQIYGVQTPDPIPKPGAPTGIAASAPMEVRSGWHLSPGLGWPLPRTRAGNRCKCRPPRNSTIGPRKSGRSNPSSPPGPRSSYSSARAWVWAPRPTYSALSWASIRTRRNGPASR